MYMRTSAVYIILVGEEMATLLSDVCDWSFYSLLGSYHAGTPLLASLQTAVLEVGSGDIAGYCGCHESGERAYACAEFVWLE